MNEIYCSHCGRSRYSLDGSRCLYCNSKDIAIPPFFENFQPAVSESANLNPGYYVPAPDASSPMTDDVWSFLDEVDPDVNYPQGSDQDATANRNLLPGNPNINKDSIYYTNIGRCNPASIDPSLESVKDSHVVLEQRTYLEEQPTSNELNNTDEDGKLNFAGAINFPSEYSIPNSNPESSVNVNSSFVLASKNSDRFPGNVVTTKSDLEHEVHYSGKARRKVSKPKVRSLRCGNCGEGFLKEWIFQVHVANKCNPDPCKCAKCGMKFRYRSQCLKHQFVHTEEERYECDQCSFSTNWEQSFKRHKDNHKK